MKSAIVLLAAVTVFTTLFLECSSTPLFTEVGSGLGNLVKKGGKDLDGVLVGVKNIVGKVDEKVKDVASGVAKKVGTVATNVKAKVTEDVGTVKQNVGEVVEKVGTVAKNEKAKAAKDIPAVKDAIKDFIDRKMETCEKTQPELTKAVEAALAADCERKEEVRNWLKNLEAVSTEIHNDVKNMFNTDTWDNCDKIVAKINKACEETKAALNDFESSLGESVTEKVDIILDCATNIAVGIKYLNSKGNNAKDMEKQFFYETMKKCDKTRAELAKAISEAKEDVKQLLENWFNGFQVQTSELHKNVKDMVDTGSWKNCDEIEAKINTACKETTAAMADFDKTLPDDMKETLKQKIESILGYAADIISALKGLKARQENDAKEYLKQLVYADMNINNEALQQFINALKDALNKASDDCKEGLTEVNDWAKKFEVKVADLHSEMKRCVDSDSLEGRDEVVNDMKAAIKDTKDDVAGFKNKIPDDLYEVMVEKIGEFIIPNSSHTSEELSKY